MKKLVFLMIVLSLVMVSCKNKEKKTPKTITDNPAVVAESKRPPDSVLIIGIWQRTNKKMWMEFRTDGTFDIGKDKEVKDSNRHWSIDTVKKTIFLDFSNGAKFIPYTVSNSRLHLEFTDRGKQIDMVRIGVRPDRQP